PLMSWSFALINLAVAVRVGLPLVGAAEIAVAGATLLWLAAFLIFVVIYAPILIRPRVDNRPG
ncbi:MAG TPA: NnrS family protein, partial [Candidatus Tenderia sp.]|nr:NnrS family protein [Candidatus Tenderia sp.]